MPLNFRQCAMLVGLSGFLLVVTTQHGKQFRMKYLGAKE